MAQGEAKGKAESVLRLLTKKGMVPEDLRKRILNERNVDVLEQWFSIAMDVKDVDDFQGKSGI